MAAPKEVSEFILLSVNFFTDVFAKDLRKA